MVNRLVAWVRSVMSVLVVLAGSKVFASSPVTIAVHCDKPGVTVSPTLYGVFFEEINRAGDGGLYAEMVQNRSFEDAAAQGVKDFNAVLGWQLVLGKDANAVMALDGTKPLNAKNPTSLRLEVKKAGERAGVANVGFKGCPQMPRGEPHKWLAPFEKAIGESRNGIAVQQGKDYDVSFYARRQGDLDKVVATIERQDGTVLASMTFSGVGNEWRKFEGRMKVGGTDTNAKLVVAVSQTGILWLDMVSLFPKDTFMGHPNGLRADLAQRLADMHPGFVRFPGGCFVEGESLSAATRWKNTIGDVAERPGHWNLWGYNSTDGLGFHEYLQFCEDIKAEPLFVINCGMSHEEQVKSNRKKPVPLDPVYVQDALDALEYANGPVDSRWGSLRAKAGHPAPFNLKYVEVGNENGGPLYHQRYEVFHDAIKARYPDVKLVACLWHGVPKGRPLDIIDEHYYVTPDKFIAMANQYDSYDRKGPRIYVGEYAVTKPNPTGTLRGAVGEAAYMTGMERNSDVVVMASYAPLFSNPTWDRWEPNAIVFDSARSYGIPSWHVQVMFAVNRADVVLAADVIEAGRTNGLTSIQMVAGVKQASHELILKIVNTAKDQKETEIVLQGVKHVDPKGTAIVLTSESANDRNSFEMPDKVAPREFAINDAAMKFRRTFPGNSVTVIKLSVQR